MNTLTDPLNDLYYLNTTMINLFNNDINTHGPLNYQSNIENTLSFKYFNKFHFYFEPASRFVLQRFIDGSESISIPSSIKNGLPLAVIIKTNIIISLNFTHNLNPVDLILILVSPLTLYLTLIYLISIMTSNLKLSSFPSKYPNFLSILLNICAVIILKFIPICLIG